MKTTDLQQEFISKKYQDIVLWASEIIGCRCADTVMTGEKEEDGDGTKYQIAPLPHEAKSTADKINLLAFEDYFYDNYGKWKDRCYFDSPEEAFFALIKAWRIWNTYLQKDIKTKYTDRATRVFEA